MYRDKDRVTDRKKEFCTPSNQPNNVVRKAPLPHGNLPSTWKHSHCNFAEKSAINNCMCKTLKMEIPAEHDLLFFKSSNMGEEKKENN